MEGRGFGGGGVRFQDYLLCGTKVETVRADLREAFPVKGQGCPL